MSDQTKENPSLLGSSTTELTGLFAQTEIKKLDSFESKLIVNNDRKILAIVLENNGCVASIDWSYNSLTKRHMARWVNQEQNLVVDVFESDEGKLRISMHHSREWISPSDSLMPRFAKSLAFALQSASVHCKYKQSSLHKYEGGKDA